MAINRDRPFKVVAPEDVSDLFDEVGLEPPDPMWYVGRIDERRPGVGHNGNGKGYPNGKRAGSGNGQTREGNGDHADTAPPTPKARRAKG